ncbi:hypothetical protein NDK47_05215 [Brevibacillus ruminantium]|uniref:Uncharacterized protein n=1 Tax=Brevibacillus ruminantium TaxID=2950604 RepID=A0ABY4WIJ6_9BACL|nr:hypothetical protein [Brevibacillus ruminantium]USG66699.1 hypothetical protein NDK47_05215 [Brevibacillus ruminantium]
MEKNHVSLRCDCVAQLSGAAAGGKQGRNLGMTPKRYCFCGPPPDAVERTVNPPCRAEYGAEQGNMILLTAAPYREQSQGLPQSR